jgi:outer membrane biosynthesis protein TonB
MSKLLENKQLLHVAGEVVILLGVTYFFTQKHKKVMAHVEDLAQRLEEQDEMIQKHEQVIRKLVETINSRPAAIPQHSLGSLRTQQPLPSRPILKRKKKPKPPVIPEPEPEPEPEPRVQFIESDDSDEDDDLDSELRNELSELEDGFGDSDEEVHLKKSQ